MPTFLQVDDITERLEKEHPTQAVLPCLKLVWQPSMQLLVILASLASFAESESGAVDAA